MIWKRMVRTAGYGLAVSGAVLANCLLEPSQALAGAGDYVSGTSQTSQENRLSLFHDYSIDVVGLTSGPIPGSAGSGIFTPLMGQGVDTSDSGRSFAVAFTPLVGYDSNPEARRYAQDGEFGGADISASYRCDIGPYDPTVGSPNQFRISYDLTGAVYSGQVKEADALQQTLAWSYRRSLFNDRVFLGLAITDQFTMEHGSAILNTLDAIPSVEWFFYPQASVEINYDYTDLTFFPDSLRYQDPNSDRSTVNLKLHLYPTPQVRGPIPDSPDVLGDILRQTLKRATVGYAAIFNQTEGPGYLYEGTRASVGFEGVRIPLFRQSPNALTLDAMYSHEWDDYMNPDDEGPLVLAGEPKHIRRKDHIDVFTLRGNARLLDLPRHLGTVGAYVQYDIIADRANIAVRHYNEYIVSGGLTYKW
jgi:hypothetical protein